MSLTTSSRGARSARPVLRQPAEAGIAQDGEQPRFWTLAGKARVIAEGAQAGLLHHILRHRPRCGSASAPDCRQRSYGAGPPARNRRAAVVPSRKPFLRCIPTSDTRPGGSAFYSRKYSGSGKAPRLFQSRRLRLGYDEAPPPPKRQVDFACAKCAIAKFPGINRACFRSSVRHPQWRTIMTKHFNS